MTSIKNTLNAGYPIVLGIVVYSSFISDSVATTGIVPMAPVNNNDYVLGGHCVVICGYDDTKQLFIMRNSWGTHWGDKGYFYLPYDYITSPVLTSDLWVLTKLQ
jgi:C1A family cysteine protease